MQVPTRGIRRWAIALALMLSSAFLIGCSGGADSDGNSGGDTPPVTEGPTEPGPGTGPEPEPNPPPTSGTDTLLNLGWQPSTENIAGYLIYYGATPETATTLASEVPISAEGFDATAPNVRYYAGRDLQLNPGDPVCFRIRAYFSDNVISDWSQAACGTV